MFPIEPPPPSSAPPFPQYPQYPPMGYPPVPAPPKSKLTPWHGLFFCVLPCLAVTAVGIALALTPATKHTADVAALSVTTDPPTSYARSSADDQFWADVEPDFPNHTRSGMIDLGHTTCEAIGAFHGDAAAMVVAGEARSDIDMTRTQWITLTAASMSAYCPQYKRTT